MIYKRILTLATLFIALIVIGCTHNVPLAVDPTKDIAQTMPQSKKGLRESVWVKMSDKYRITYCNINEFPINLPSKKTDQFSFNYSWQFIQNKE